jgi:hypothetical protein
MHNVGMLSIDLQKLVLTMTATVESTTVKSPAVKPATVEFAACGIALTSVIPPTVETSRQAEGYNQKHQRQSTLFSLPDASAGGENDERSGGHPVGDREPDPASCAGNHRDLA